MTPLLTVFTPTYNRAYTLPQLYESLCRQTGKDFVWSIVDDGSTDGTEEMVSRWIGEQRIPILYRWQPNGGKMRAHNRGVRECTTPLFMCVDSDDFVPDDLVDSIREKWPLISGKGSVAGFVAYKSIKGEDGDVGVKCPFPGGDCVSLERLYDSGFFGDTTLVFKTELIRRFPFLEVEGETFSTEAYAYDQIDRAEYVYQPVEEVWTICTYLPDGYTLTEKKLYAKNPKGWALYYNQKALFTGRRLSQEKVEYGILYMIFARRSGMKHIYRQSALKTPFYPVFWLMSYYYEWKWRKKYPK